MFYIPKLTIIVPTGLLSTKMNRNTSTVVKITVAILLILCLGNMPYTFYVLVRFVAAGAFSFSLMNILEQSEKA